jgi:LTXXQ motif family protein
MNVALPSRSAFFRRLSLALAAAIALPLVMAAGSALAQQQADLTTLHDALRLTSTQEVAWRSFAAASAPDPSQSARESTAEQMLPRLTAPQRVDLSIAVMEADLDTLRTRGQALKAFYAMLTPAQQAEFDRQTTPREQSQSSGYPAPDAPR